jgi:hypothetical protein
LTVEAFQFRAGAEWMADANRFIDEHIRRAIRDSNLNDVDASLMEGTVCVDLSARLTYLSANVAAISVAYENYIGQADLPLKNSSIID